MKLTKFMLKRLNKNPYGLIKRSIGKTIIRPIKYKRKNDYDAEKFWYDRFNRYSYSLKGVGDEGISETNNAIMYYEAGEQLIDELKRNKLNFKKINVLDVGCGNGYYTQILKNLGVKEYVGIDITDNYFPKLRTEFEEFYFIKRDITNLKSSYYFRKKFDLIIMLDVIEHIVTEEKLDSAMNNIKSNLSDDGVFILAPLFDTSKKIFFYLKLWTLADIKKRFNEDEYVIKESTTFRNGKMVSIRRKK